MTVWAEQPGDGGSAIWACTTCDCGGWCSDHTTALIEARTHARGHGDSTVNTHRAHHGPTAPADRDADIHRLRTEGNSIRQIAAIIGLSNAGIIKALRRRENAS